MTPFLDPQPIHEVRVCVTGAPVDGDGVCAEHGETACVVGRK